MTTAVAEQPKQEITNPAKKFRNVAASIAGSLLKDWVGPEKAAEATGRISAALAASAASAKNPSDFYACTPQSIAQCVAIAALTDIMPGTGTTALAYVVPQRPRKNEAPQLQFNFSHRGLNALARRTGQTMIAVPVGHTDKIEVDESGGVNVVERDIDNPPTTEKELRGVVVQIVEINRGTTIARGWVPWKLIQQRKKMSRSASSQYSPWSNWPVEMAMKTAMHYAIARGWCVIDDAAAARGLTQEQNYDLLTQQRPQLLTEPQRSKSDALAAELASNDGTTDAEDDQQSPATEDEPQDVVTMEQNLLADIERCEDIEEANRINNDIEGAKVAGDIDASQAKALKEKLEAKAETL